MNWRQKLAANAFEWSDRVLYVDRSLILFNKPPNFVTQVQSPDSSLVNLLDDLKQGLDLPTTPRRIHRLDKDTTGCLLFARSLNVAHDLSGQFQRRTVHKSYLALVCGGSRSFSERKGKIRNFLDHPNGRATVVDGPVDAPSSKESMTDWELLASSPNLPLSLVRLKLLTGRKHQLRVHLAQVLKTPILGDTLHSQNQPVEQLTDSLILPDNRMFLHASKIEFFRYRPVGKKKQFKIRMFAPLPQDFLEICSQAGIPVSDEERLGGLFKSDTSKDRDFQPVSDGEIPEVNGQWI